MSTFALTQDFFAADTRRSRAMRSGRKAKLVNITRPWTEITVADTSSPPPQKQQSIPTYAWVLIGLVALAHGGFAWYTATHTQARTPPPHRNEVAVQLERPKPVEPPPKVEPPKPVPPKQQLQRPAQILPQIQQAAPEANDASAVSSEPPIAVAPIAAAPAPVEVPVTPAFGKAGYLNNPPPDYPPQAARQGWQGTVLLRVRVSSKGTAEAVEVEKSSGRKILDDEALRTVKRWSFVPAKRGDTPVDGVATVPIEFKVEV